MAERLTRTTVVHRAALLSDDIGLSEITITKLGRELGIAPPGVYRHVADLSDLRAAIGTQATHGLTAVLSSACAGLSKHDALLALATTLRSWAIAHPGQYEALQIAPAPGNVAGQEASTEIITVFSSALRAYGLAGDDLTDAIRLIRATLHGFVTLELNEGVRQRRSLEATYERAVTSLDAVLTSWSV